MLEVPDDWRKVNVVHIFKKGKKCDPANYIPTSLTCICCKALENIIESTIMKHGNENNTLYKLNIGFGDKRACEVQLLEFQTDILTNRKNGKQTNVLIMEFSKAFDKVGHQNF